MRTASVYGAETGTTCSTPTSIEHANIRVKSYNENSRERYVCNSGFKRKAGTSSLTRCLRNEDTNVTEWTIPSLKCVSVHSYRWTGVMVTVPILFAVLCGAAIVALCRAARCRPWRQTSWTPSVEMENVEDAPMTGGADGGEDTENHHAV